MEREAISTEVIEMIRDEEMLDLPTDFSADDDLFEAGLDSMAVMQLIVVIQEKFGAILSAADANREALGTPARIAATIEARR